MSPRLKKITFIVFPLLLIIGGGTAYYLYNRIFRSEVKIPDGKEYYDLKIPTGVGYDVVFETLKRDNILKDVKTFDWIAKQMDYPAKVKPGRYIIKAGMTNRQLVAKLRSGAQDPIKYTFLKFRLPNDIAASVKGKFEFKGDEVGKLLNDDTFLRESGVNPNTAIAFFIPNTYTLNWNITSRDFFNRMKSEYNKFWNDDREKKREKLGLSRIEIMTVASIVEEETNQNDEKERIAGVYLNRLKKNWTLGADPTVKYAVGDFSLRRITNAHTQTPSPYNTYLNTGLPPGPICTPSIPSIDAVLNAEEHEYMYFCARPDLSGHHNFAKDAAGHKKNADEYHIWLTQYLKEKKEKAALEKK